MYEKDKIIDELKTQVQSLIKRIKELEEEIARLKKNSNNSSKPPSSDIVKPKKTTRKVSGKKQGRSVFKYLHKAVIAHWTEKRSPLLLCKKS